jgi:HEAT repeat protein
MNRLSLWWALIRLKFGGVTTRWLAAGDLGKSGDARAVKPLMRLLLDKKGWRAYEASSALQGLGRLAVEPLRLQLQHKEATVRIMVIRTLSGVAYDQTVTDLLAALKDQDDQVRHNVVTGLSRQCGKIGFNGLLSLLNAREPDARSVAVEELLHRLGRKSEPP